MTIAMQPIYTQTVGSGGAAGINFTNIPSTFTDLKIVLSVRPTRAAQTWDSIGLVFNNDASGVYSGTLLYAGVNGAGPASSRLTGQGSLNFVSYASTSSATANTFGNSEVYIPNYTSSNFKSVVADSAAETNGTSDWIQTLSASLWRSTAAINQVYVYALSGGAFAQYSTVSIYGITKG